MFGKSIYFKNLFHASYFFREILSFIYFCIPDCMFLPQTSLHSHAQLVNKVLQIWSREAKEVSANLTSLIIYYQYRSEWKVSKSLVSPPDHLGPSHHLPSSQSPGSVPGQWLVWTLVKVLSSQNWGSLLFHSSLSFYTRSTSCPCLMSQPREALPILWTLFQTSAPLLPAQNIL